MGLFNDILEAVSNSIHEANEKNLEAAEEAENWKIERICSKIETTTSISVRSGYGRTLRSKCENLNNNQLKRLFDTLRSSNNLWACRAIMPVMEKRKLAYKGDDGKIILTYKSKY